MNSVLSHIYLLTSKNRFYGQSRKPWVPLDTDRIASGLRKNGFRVTELEYHQAVANILEIKNSVILYSFSQIDNTRQYLKDLARALMLQGNILLPSYDLLLCHENKGYQELYKQSLGVRSLSAGYYCTGDDLDFANIRFPIVLKSVDGSNANGVHLVHSRKELDAAIKRMEKKLSLFDTMDLIRRKYFRTKRTMPGWENYNPSTDELQYRYHITPRIRFVLQDFIPGLDCDYRVIVLGTKYYVSKRMTRKGDWRASGTKLFTYDTVPDSRILDYAMSFYNIVDLPVLAMDLGLSGDKVHLFEFQASHFGITPIQRGPGFFAHDNGHWAFNPAQGCFEDDLATAVADYLIARSKSLGGE